MSSIVWSIYTKPDEIVDYVPCPICNASLAYKGTTTGLMRHLKNKHVEQYNELLKRQPPEKQRTSVEPHRSVQKAIEPQEVLATSFCSGRIPFNFVDNPDFIRFCRLINPKFKMPNAKNIKETIENMKMSHISDVAKKLEGLKHYVLVTDNCSKDSPFFSVHAVYVNPTTFERKLLLCDIRNLPAPNFDILESCSLQSSQVTVVISDNIGDQFGLMKQLSCSGIAVNEIFGDFVERVEIVKELYEEVKRIFEKLNKNEEDLELAKSRWSELRQQSEYAVVPLPIFPIPKWGSLFFMLQSYSSNVDILSSIPCLQNKIISYEKIIKIQEIVTLLDPLNRALEQLTDVDSFCSDIIPNLLSVKEELDANDKMSKVLIALIQEKINYYLSNDTTIISMLCDPRYAYVPNLIDPMTWDNVERLLSQEEIFSTSECSKSYDNSQKKGIGGLLKRKLEKAEVMKTLPSEIRHYQALMSTHRPFHTSNPLLFWKDQAHNFPRLSLIAVKFLTVMASTSPCEKLYRQCSKGGKEAHNKDQDLFLFGHAISIENGTEQSRQESTTSQYVAPLYSEKFDTMDDDQSTSSSYYPQFPEEEYIVDVKQEFDEFC